MATNEHESSRAHNEGEMVLYQTQDGTVKVECVFADENLWLTQGALAELFGVEVPAVSKHLSNIYESGELEASATLSKMETVRQEGNRKVRRTLDYYNLDAIIAVGYRVNSYEATQFRIWATKTLKEFMIKGFVLDDERLKQGKTLFGKDYFDELLERIREIRASERRFYQKITDIYALAVDYDKDAPISREFFATVQNKLHWAITGKTAAETIHVWSSTGTSTRFISSTWRWCSLSTSSTAGVRIVSRMKPRCSTRSMPSAPNSTRGAGDYFGVINVGEPKKLWNMLEEENAEQMVCSEQEFSFSLFDDIKEPGSRIRLLVGAKKFTEGWNCWRVSCMGLVNIGRNLRIEYQAAIEKSQDQLIHDLKQIETRLRAGEVPEFTFGSLA